ncbi:MAG: TatD family hydrolase [Alphaproteobacteria bacterium]|nr:TatD family hydrolase [Alphaproteobacteria bacterium]
MFTDSHCHISCEDFSADREEVISRAREMKVDYILDVSDDIAKTAAIVEFCKKHNHIYTTVGVHPEIADKYPNLKVEELLNSASSPYVVGIGECGLDYFYNSDIKDMQLKVFDVHIKAAQKSGLPLIVHSRDADEDMINLLKNAYKNASFKGELHCFSSSRELCRAALDIGFYISASGIITFNKSEELRDIFKYVPNERLLIETDAPYLAPAPHRGKRNEPSYVVNTAEMLSEIKKMPVEEIARITTDNFLRLFTKVKQND